MRREDSYRKRRLLGVAIAVLVLAGAVGGQQGTRINYGNRLGYQVGDRSAYSSRGVSVLIDALDPTIQRWYLPQELFLEYGRRQWDYTNYAREPFRRYLNTRQEGFYFYDVYGDFVTRGWRIYDWRQTQPSIFETSAITKDPNYSNWFNRLIISTDAIGDYSYAIIVGDEINTTLTPMTFRKAGFNGVMTSLSSSRFRATGLFSRVNAPVIVISGDNPTSFRENFTHLTAGRMEVDATESATLGFTLVNTHNGSGTRESFSGNPLKGQLTVGQLGQRLNLLVVRLSDDSPEDGEGGAVLFTDEIEITTTLMRPVAVGDSVQLAPRDTVIIGSSLGFQSVREGGKLKGGFLTADGPESITLKYVLTPTGEGATEEGTLRMRLQQALGLSLSEADDAIAAIKSVRFRMIVANDYRIEVASDRQTNPGGQPQFLLVERADGNIKNQLNQREVVFDYGLPTANHLFGMTAELRDFYGFDFYGEFNLNYSYRQYPTPGLDKHRSAAGIEGDEEALAFMVNLSRRSGPMHLFFEAFGMDDGYTTTILPVDGGGISDYSPEATQQFYDYIDDNDDNDRHPDLKRANQGSLIPPQSTTQGRFVIQPEGVADPAIFPGYDENGDFLSDFNQNSNGDRENFFPDYEEPFLRHNTDRPDFLFGIDLNNNGWVDRFENDHEPDYPYKKDHWGYNLYGSAEIVPQVKMTLGYLRQDQHETARNNYTAYGMLMFERNWPGWGNLRVFDMAKQVEDTIPDDLVQWIIPDLEFGDAGDTGGRIQAVPDLLAAEDTWINTFYTEWSYNSPRRWATQHKFKWEFWKQRDADVIFQMDEEGNPLLDEEGMPLVAFDPLGPEERNGREDSGFIGLIDKIDYEHWLGPVSFRPRLKSEFLRRTPFGLNAEKQRSWDLIPSFLVKFPLMRNSVIEIGWEGRQFYNLKGDEGDLETGDITGDFRGTVLALQLTNGREYLGYRLTSQVGLRYDRRSLEVIDREDETRTSGLAFISIYAGLD